jgi:methyltransferase (TIGR00027 family)
VTNTGIEQKPSETALFAALRRTLAHKEFNNEIFGPDYLAEHFLPAHFRFFLRFRRVQKNTRERLNSVLPGLNEFMIARTAHFDRLFADALKDKTPQIVLLGAGYDSRAYRFEALNRGTKVFELDIAPTQNRKKECLKKAKITVPRFVTFVPIDFNTDLLGDVLQKAGYGHHQKTLFLWEGVSYYLEAQSVDETLEFVSQDSYHDSTIAFDYTITISEDNRDSLYGATEFAQTMKEQHASEELMFSIEEGEISAFLAQRGLTMIDHLDNEEIETAYLLNDFGSLLGQITGHFRFVAATPRSSPN